MDGKIKVLFHNLDGAGVNYFRTQTPAMELERNHSDNFHVEINPQIDFQDPSYVEYLKSFHVVHYHRQFVPDTKIMFKLSQELKKSGTQLVMDIDDYWYLHPNHPFYGMAKERKMHIPIMENLKIADYVTTTTDLFADKIREITKKDNVEVFYNSIDPKWMKQFKNNWKPDPDGLVRITYMAGSSHMGDVRQLDGVVNYLQSQSETRDKFKIIIAGWDTEGSTTEVIFNEDFGNELKRIGMWVKPVVDAINRTRGNVDMIPNLPEELKEKYRGKVFSENKRDIKSEESVYLTYEKILTDNHRLIQNDDYLEWLMNFERNVKYPEEGNFARRWTQKANMYATVLDETDIMIAPLADHDFNRMKCVVGNTLVPTNNGIFKIEDLVNNKANVKIFDEKILSFFKYPQEKTLKLITNIGLEIEGTPTHKLFVCGEWKSISDFNVGDVLEISPYEIESNKYQKIRYPMLLSKKITADILGESDENMIPAITINEDYGRFFGYMLGDGHFSTNYLRISCDKRCDDVVEDVIMLGKKMGLSPFKIEKIIDKRCESSIKKGGNGVDIQLTSKHLANICIQENLKNNEGKVFEVPHFILRSPKSVIREFLRGLFEADGTVSAEGSFVSITSKSLTLIKQIQVLLIGFGIIGKIQIAPNKRYKRNYFNLRLGRDASDIFYQKIGFVSKIKQEKLKCLTEKPHSNRYEEQKMRCEIVKIVEGVNDVYDVEVESKHSYIGNGLLNHNSNLKQVECWSRKLPVVCTDIPPYNVHGRHMENCVLIPNKKNAHKYWKKYLKQLILDADLRKRLGEQLYEDFGKEYHLANVTKKRAEFYEKIVAKTLQVV
jgi:intein/homing endonuclease